jgi:toxin ParE1/3/4
MPRILKRPRAQADLAEIWELISEDSQARADSFLDRLDQSFHGLAGNPHIGRARSELCPNLRSFPVGRRVIFIWCWRMESRSSGCSMARAISTLFSMPKIEAAFQRRGSLDPKIIAQGEADEKDASDRKEVLEDHQELKAFGGNGEGVSIAASAE